MLTDIRDLLRLLTSQQRRCLLLMQVLMVAGSLLELLNVSAVFPFLMALSRPTIIREHALALALYDRLGCTSSSQFLTVLACLLVALTLLANTVHLLNLGLANHFAHRLCAEFSSRLYDYYLSQDLLYHAVRNSSVLASRVINDTERVSRLFITSLLRLNGRIFVIAALSILLLWTNWPVAVCALVVLASSYYAILQTIRRRVLAGSQEVTELNARRLQQFNEGIAGLREVKLSASEAVYSNAFATTSRTVGLQLARVATIAAFPYYVIETLAISGMVVVVLLYARSAGGVAAALPVSGLFAMAGYKLLPAFQQSYHALTEMRSSKASFEAIRDDLLLARGVALATDAAVLIPKETIELRQVGVHYEGRPEALFSGVDLTLPVGKTILILGPSGGGKSTLLELILGLIPPTEGHVLIDGRTLQPHEFAALRRAVGYVPQSIYLTDSTLGENIAFGEARHAIDSRRLRTAARMAGLADWIEQLPGGYDVVVGEQGVQLSGGQLQRVGIARALYRDVPILLLDEASSALDYETEEDVMTGLCAAATGKTIIIVTHRLRTMRFADCVVRVDQGKVSFYASVDEFMADKGRTLDDGIIHPSKESGSESNDPLQA
jgi:ATP-binding cassette, subfamily B, bacterial PglK